LTDVLQSGTDYAAMPVNINIQFQFKPGQFLVINFFLNVFGKLPISKLTVKVFRSQLFGTVESYRYRLPISGVMNIDL